MWKGHFTEEIGAVICERIADGDSLRQICQDLGIPSRARIYEAIEADAFGFADKYARARDWQGESDADDMSSVRVRVEKGELGHQEGRVVMDALKWTAARRRPRKYGAISQGANAGDEGDDNTITVVNAPE